MKTLYIIIILVLFIIIGWLIPIDGPFDIKPEEVIEQYEARKPSKGIPAPLIIKKEPLTEEELEFLEEQYQTRFVPVEIDE